MALIYESTHFTVESAEEPFVDRSEGGHIRIFPKEKVSDRTKLSFTKATEYIKISMVIGEAFK